MASKKVTSLIAVLVLSISLAAGSVQAKIETILGGVPLPHNPNLATNPPLASDLEVIISRDQYVLSYNKEKRLPNWVAWKLEANQMGSSGRSNNFEQDSELENYLTQIGSETRAVLPNEYAGDCFDRGHQVPSGDRTDTVQNNQATFVMSNVIPQTAFLNRGVWEHLEQYTRNLVQQQGKKVYVIAGPIFDDNFGFIGPNKDIPVPSKDFKIIIVLEANQTPADINANTPIISVIMPNTLQDGSKPIVQKNCSHQTFTASPNKLDWEQYKTTPSEIQKSSGLTISLLPRQ